MKKLFRIKDIKEIEKLSTKRLLSYYKARRKNRYAFYSSYTCDCCGESSWDLYPNDKSYQEAKKELEILDSHLEQVRDLLNKREHVKR